MCPHEFQPGFCVFGRVARKRCKFTELTFPPILLGLSLPLPLHSPEDVFQGRFCGLQPGTRCHAVLSSLLGSEIAA